MKRLLILPLFAIITCVALPVFAQEDGPLLPSAAYKQIIDARRAGGEEQIALATALLKRIDASNLDLGELWNYGNVLQAAGRKAEAKAAMEKVAAPADIFSRRAYVAMMFFAYEDKDVAALETLLDRYYATFKPSAQNAGNICSVIAAWGSWFHMQGENERVIAMVNRELDFLNYDAPFFSWTLPGDLAGAWIATGRKDECIALMEKLIAGIEAKVATLPADDKSAAGYKRHAATIKNRLFQVRLIGTPAPEITVTDAINAAPLKLADLRGKVVMLDFWATWCGPCKRAFPGMAKIYAEYKDRGFEILGVTGYQKSFNDGDIKEKEITPLRELELTKAFVAKYGMTWPVVYSDRNCFDPAYGVTGIPTFVLIDQEGIVRVIESGSDNEEVLRFHLNSLLSR